MKKEPDYKSILTVVGGFLLLYFAFKQQAFIYVAFGVAGLSLASSFLARKLVWLWHKLGEGLGYVNARILLTIIFYIFLAPVAFLYRLSHKDPIKLNKIEGEGSYYTIRDYTFEGKDLEKPW